MGSPLCLLGPLVLDPCLLAGNIKQHIINNIEPGSFMVVRGPICPVIRKHGSPARFNPRILASPETLKTRKSFSIVRSFTLVKACRASLLIGSTACSIQSIIVL